MLPVGVVVLDAEGKAVVYNAVEERLAGRRREEVLGRDFFREHAICMDIPEMAGVFREKIGRESFFVEGDFSFPFPLLAIPREVRVQLTSFESSGQHYGLLVIRDVAYERSVDRVRETLTQMFVHDVKNPLTAITLSLSLVEMRARDDVLALEALADAREGCRRIETVLMNLLDTARLETNAFPLATRDVDLAELTGKAASLCRVAALAASCTVEVETGPEPVVANVDPDIVVRIVRNLVDNALRFAKRVKISTVVEDGQAVIVVADDGPGIPFAARGKIFEKYAQVGQEGAHARARNQGLGLTFVQLAARAHGGHVAVDCPPSGGTVFRVSFPDHPRPASS